MLEWRMVFGNYSRDNRLETIFEDFMVFVKIRVLDGDGSD